ncbi:AAA domain-containing protein [Thiothrix subterranea]|uniref:AAA family ATPase n=1 Tax=Thiothrix subterranea TaxID=2735563 RepID=UPI00192B4035|nr:AAA family ATPase [Thiothrix subterranea]QQZ29642.1 AAA domain-containing protein [Thiothrix subterranea]
MLNDKWGILRHHEENYGILRNTCFTHSEEYEFERLLKSSISLNANFKIKIIVGIPKLSVKKIHGLIDTFKSEISEFNSLSLQEKNNIETLIKEKEYEWKKIEIYLEGYLSMHMNTDNNRNMTPSSIKGLMEKMVKGQGEAARSIATLLYYHNAVSTAYTLNHTLPFKTPAPIMIIGGTGTGKSFMLEVGCDIVGLPYMHVDCSSLVSTGIVGNTVDDILKNLLRKVNYNIKKAETSIVLFDEIDKLLSHHDGQSILHQLLRIIEGSIVPIDDHKSEERLKEIKNISTHQMLFIFAGSFQKVID